MPVPLNLPRCRGALIAPWLFQEHREGRALSPTASERVGIYRQ